MHTAVTPTLCVGSVCTSVYTHTHTHLCLISGWMEMSLDSSIFLDYSCCVQEPQACFYGSYSQFSYFLNPHLAVRRRCCDTLSECVTEGLRVWAELCVGDRLTWEGLVCSRLQHGLLWHQSLGFPSRPSRASPDLSLSPFLPLLFFFFSFFSFPVALF